jgi:hypothetical protein
MVRNENLVKPFVFISMKTTKVKKPAKRMRIAKECTRKKVLILGHQYSNADISIDVKRRSLA